MDNNTKDFENLVHRYHGFSTGEYSEMYKAVVQNFEAVQFSYKGPFSSDSLMLINKFIESFSTEEKTGSRTSLFKVFIEMAQNIAENSIEREKNSAEDIGNGLIIVSENENEFEIVSGNPAKTEDIEHVVEKLAVINACNFKQLRELRRKLLKQHDTLNNGNIGLVKIALVSQTKIKYEVIPGDEKVGFLVLRTRLIKE